MRDRVAGVLALATCLAFFPGCANDDTAVGGVDAALDATLDAGIKHDAAADAGDASRSDASDAATARDAAKLDPITGCVTSGGAIATASCCFQSGDFPDTCTAGACSCAPQFSVPTKVCTCPAGTCFGAKIPACVPWDGGLFPP
jgi:hypothetical protein